MGGLIFFLLILICSIVAGIEQLAQGRINGLWYILVPGVIIVAFVIALIKQYNKDKKKYLPTSIKQKILPKNDSFYDYWNKMREKALHGPLATEELYEHLAKVFEEGHYSNVEDVSKQGIKILKGTNKNGEKYTFFSLEDTDLDFDKLADISEFIKTEKLSGSKINYVAQQVPKQPYTNLFKKCMMGEGVKVYDTITVLDEANKMLGIVQAQNLSQVSEKKVAKVQKPKYEKVFPHMMSSDDDPEELQELDDMMVMDTLDEDDDMF